MKPGQNVDKACENPGDMIKDIYLDELVGAKHVSVGEMLRFPVQGMHYDRIESGLLRATGWEGDHLWEIADRQSGEALGILDIPRLPGYRVREGYVITPGKRELEIGSAELDQYLSDQAKRDVEMRRVMDPPKPFAILCPSVAQMAIELKKSIPFAIFRAPIVIQFGTWQEGRTRYSYTDRLVEGDLDGHFLRMGDAVVRIGKPVPHGEGLNVHHEKGYDTTRRKRDYFAALQAVGGHMGAYFDVLREGRVTKGDKVVIE